MKEKLSQKNNEITNFSFSKSDFPLNNFETNTITFKKTQELSSINLFKCLMLIYGKNLSNNNYIENCKESNLKNIFKEIYKRLIIPFYIPVLASITFLLFLSSKENTNYFKFKLYTFILGLFFIIFSETTIRLISETFYSNLLIVIIPYSVFILLYLTFIKKLSFKIISK